MYSGLIHVEKAERAGAKLIADAVVYRVEIGAGNRVSAVHYKDLNGASHRVTGKFFVLAANGIETPRLLLLSAEDAHPRGVANSSDQVGRNMMDHPGTGVTFLANEALWPGRGAMEMTSVVNFRDAVFPLGIRGEKITPEQSVTDPSRHAESAGDGAHWREVEQEIRYRSAHTSISTAFMTCCRTRKTASCSARIQRSARPAAAGNHL